ncbi:hypothetical protein SCFA_990011 [anaerobic digester metagenome]|uniref:Uncharacterized protein n=1 Tax=anaerobic digester metagenome TaxID=1263854 RepID=A0A485M875_9ZZZZ
MFTVFIGIGWMRRKVLHRDIYHETTGTRTMIPIQQGLRGAGEPRASLTGVKPRTIRRVVCGKGMRDLGPERKNRLSFSSC